MHFDSEMPELLDISTKYFAFDLEIGVSFGRQYFFNLSSAKTYMLGSKNVSMQSMLQIF